MAGWLIDCAIPNYTYSLSRLICCRCVFCAVCYKEMFFVWLPILRLPWWSNVESVLGQRRRRCLNVSPPSRAWLILIDSLPWKGRFGFCPFFVRQLTQHAVSLSGSQTVLESRLCRKAIPAQGCVRPPLWIRYWCRIFRGRSMCDSLFLGLPSPYGGASICWQFVILLKITRNEHHKKLKVND